MGNIKLISTFRKDEESSINTQEMEVSRSFSSVSGGSSVTRSLKDQRLWVRIPSMADINFYGILALQVYSRQ